MIKLLQRTGPCDCVPLPLAVAIGLVWLAQFGARAAEAPVTATVITNRLVDVPIRRSEYVMRTWESEEGGLPQNLIQSIAQTPDGYLWCATFNGLARYDGANFKIFDAANAPALKSSRVQHVRTDRAGRLWILSESGSVASFAEGKFTAYGASEGVPESGFREVIVDAGGNLWATARFQEGLFLFSSGRFIRGIDASRQTFGSVFHAAAADDGSLWGLSPSRGNAQIERRYFLRLFPGIPERIDAGPGQPGDRPAGLTSSRQGGVWLAAQRSLHLYQGGRRARTLYLPAVDTLGSTLYEDRAGKVWVGSRSQGLLQFDGTGTVRRFLLDDGVPLQANAIFEDREGNLWLGLNGGGLGQLRARVFSSYDQRDGLPAGEVRSVSEDAEGGLWVVTREGVCRLLNGGTVETIRPKDVYTPTAAAPGRAGELWVATYDAGLYRYAGGQLTRFLAPFQNRFFGPRSWGVHFSRRNEVILAARDGAYTVQGDRLKLQEIPGLPGYDLRAVADDAQGRLYFGINGNGLVVGDGARWSHYTSTNGLAGNDVWSLHVDGDGAAWLGTIDHGLSRFKDGRFVHFQAVSSLPRVVNSIVEDDAGFLWLGSNQGVYRVSRRELNEFAAGRRTNILSTQYGTGDGLASGACSADYQPGAWKGRDGRIWFATAKGVSVVDPRRLPANPLPPPALIEEVFIDDRPAALGAGMPLVVPPGNRRIEVRYSSPSFSAPSNVRFRYKLTGLDESWTDVGMRRSAYFQGLSPGRYELQIEAGNNEGAWNSAAVALVVAVQPFYWQSASFRLAVAVVLILLICLFYQRRIAALHRRRIAQQEFSRKLIESQELERKRMAAELHDSLGQKLQLIRNCAQLALQRGPPAVNPAVPLEEISGLTGDAINEIRAITHALRPAELEQVGLSRALGWMVENVAKASGLRVLADIDHIDGLLSADNEMNLYRIVQECMNNIIKHAGATQATVEIKRRDNLLHLAVFDNGRGFDTDRQVSAEARYGGLGLAGIGERVRILGGEHRIHSNPGKGTRVTVTLPLPAR